MIAIGNIHSDFCAIIVALAVTEPFELIRTFDHAVSVLAGYLGPGKGFGFHSKIHQLA